MRKLLLSKLVISVMQLQVVSDTDRQWLWRFSEATMSDLFEVNLGLSIVPKNLSS